MKYILRRECLIWSVHKKRISFLIGTAHHLYTPKLALLFITIPIGRKLTHLCHGMLTWILHLDYEFACYRHLDDGLPWSCLENPSLWCVFIILRDVHLDFNYILVI